MSDLQFLPEVESHWILIAYALAGIGLYGGYRGWIAPFRLLYFCIFPIHWLLWHFWEWRQRNPETARVVDEGACNLLGGAFELIGGLLIWMVIYLWLLSLGS